MRQEKFKMERTGLLEVGDVLPIKEYTVGVSYYYVLGNSYAMSANYSILDRIKSTEGKVLNVEETPRGYYVTVEVE
ncbi:MAG: hypothetical protein K5773_03275 [Pseudobutyrivibrio sp.]|nr:hypothetical protein [Pseudobutyrivibrio sp.]